MDPRFQRDASNPKFVGVQGKTHADSTDIRRDAHPISTDGPLVTGAIFQDLESGDWWYWNGNAWMPVTTKEDLIRVEIIKLRQTMDDRWSEALAILGDIRDAVQSIP